MAEEILWAFIALFSVIAVNKESMYDFSMRAYYIHDITHLIKIRFSVIKMRQTHNF